MRGVSARLAGVEGSAVREILKLTQSSDVLSMAGGLPAADLFDGQALSDAFASVLTEPGLRDALQYSTTEGDPQLREELAALTHARGLDVDAARVIVTTGSQQALDLAVTALSDPGDVVIVERPCYLAALQLFRLSGLKVVTAATDADGLDPAAVAEQLEAHPGARLVYTVPNFQNPTGATLAADRRAAIAELARRHDAWIIEDDPYGELRYAGESLEPLAVHAPDRTVYVSSLSKIVAPGMRIGWLVAPAALHAPLVTAKQARDLHTSTVDQRAAAHYLRSGALPRHLAALRHAYRGRLQALLGGLAAAVPDGARWTTPQGGMFVWLTVPDHDTEALLPAAIRQGVAFVPGATFYADEAPRDTLRLSFVTQTEPQVAEGLRRLRIAFKSG